MTISAFFCSSAEIRYKPLYDRKEVNFFPTLAHNDFCAYIFVFFENVGEHLFMEKGPGTKPLRCAQKTRIDVETLEVHMVARSECRIPSLRKGIEAEFSSGRRANEVGYYYACGEK